MVFYPSLLSPHQLLFAPFATVDQWQADPVVIVDDLAVEAVMALVGIDLAGGANGPHRTAIGANLAGLAAFLASPQPPFE